MVTRPGAWGGWGVTDNGCEISLKLFHSEANINILQTRMHNLHKFYEIAKEDFTDTWLPVDS